MTGDITLKGEGENTMDPPHGVPLNIDQANQQNTNNQSNNTPNTSSRQSSSRESNNSTPNTSNRGNSPLQGIRNTSADMSLSGSEEVPSDLSQTAACQVLEELLKEKKITPQQ